MVHHYLGCGECTHCVSGWSQLCLHGVTVYGATGHGSHAQFMKVAASTLVPLPDELSFQPVRQFHAERVPRLALCDELTCLVMTPSRYLARDQ